MRDLKKLEEDIKEARLALIKVKSAGTKFPHLKKMQVKAGLYDKTSNFTHIILTDIIGDMWSDHVSKIEVLINEINNWIKGLQLTFKNNPIIDAFLLALSFGTTLDYVCCVRKMCFEKVSFWPFN